MENNQTQDELSTYEESSSEQEQEQDQEVTFHPSPGQQNISNMFMPYI